MTERSAAAAGSDARTAERKLLTLLFADLSGYTQLTATRDPEDVLTAVGPLLAELRQVALDHGGYVPSVQGDGFMSVFGTPIAHADDPLRALSAAVAMKSVVTGRRRATPDVPDIHIGVASGEVLVTSESDRHDVIGPAVNLAARLSDAAAPGEVLVDESAAALTSDHAVFGPARPLSLHGFAGVVRAMPLEAVRLSATVAAPLAGRREHLGALEAALERVHASGRSDVLLLVGEPGAGKSHVVTSWTQQLADVMVVRGTARPYGSALPLSALSEAIINSHATGDEQGRDDFVRLLPRQRPGPATGREPDEAIHVAARRWLERAARRQPVVVVLEDLHWADAPLIEVLRDLVKKPLLVPLLILGTSREPMQELAHRYLHSLTTDEVRDVVRQRIGAEPDPHLLQLLVDRSGGNALWLVECLGLLRDRGQLRIMGEIAGLSDQEAEVEVPASIRMLIAARMDNLPVARKQMLQRVSVHPGDIPHGRLGDAHDLDALTQLGLLERTEHGQVRFSHSLIREAVYRSMPRAERVQEHEGILEGLSDPAAFAYAACEVQRLDVAPSDERRIFVAARALDAVTAHARHLRMSHTRAARDVLRRAEALCTELDLIAPRSAAGLLTELAEVLRDLEEVERSRHVAERAVAVADVTADVDTLARAQLALGEALRGSNNAQARNIAEHVLTTASGPSTLRGRAWRLLASSHSYDDAAELVRLMTEAFHCYVAAGETALAAEAARNLAFNLSLTADATFDRWLAVATANTAPDHMRGQGELALVRAVVAQARGAWEESWEAAESAMNLLERAGMHQSLVNALAVALEAATATGRRTVIPGLINRLSSLVDGHRPRLQITALCAIAPAFAVVGREADAVRALESATQLLASVGPIEEAMVRVAEGHCAEVFGRHELAESAFARAEKLTAELGFRLSRLASRLERLQIQVSRGGRPGLRGELLSLAVEFEEAGAEPYAERTRALAQSLSA